MCEDTSHEKKDLGRERVFDVAVQHKTRMCEDKPREKQILRVAVQHKTRMCEDRFHKKKDLGRNILKQSLRQKHGVSMKQGLKICKAGRPET